MKRILLFVMTNLAVVVVLGVVASLLGVNRYLTANGLNLGALLGFALVMGFGGAIISLLISKPMAKWTSGVRVIDGSGSPDERWIVETVRKFATEAKIGMPEVGIFYSFFTDVVSASPSIRSSLSARLIVIAGYSSTVFFSSSLCSSMILSKAKLLDAFVTELDIVFTYLS